MNKRERHRAIRERASAAIRDLYHNATITYPRICDDALAQRAQDWLRDEAEQEIDYIASGGAYPGDYRATLEHPANGGKYKSEAARRYYVRKGLRSRDEERAKYAAWERISKYGRLYTWGRGGRTLAPDRLISQRGGGSFSVKESYADELPIAKVVELIHIVESFNAYVEAWCKGVPDMWEQYISEERAEQRAAKKRAAAAKAKETRERNYWAARDVVTVR